MTKLSYLRFGLSCIFVLNATYNSLLAGPELALNDASSSADGFRGGWKLSKEDLKTDKGEHGRMKNFPKQNARKLRKVKDNTPPTSSPADSSNNSKPSNASDTSDTPTDLPAASLNLYNNLTVDIISVGSIHKQELQTAQKQIFASHPGSEIISRLRNEMTMTQLVLKS